ncbi:MAG TPA: cyclase family protein [Pseudomonadales bacterium]
MATGNRTTFRRQRRRFSWRGAGWLVLALATVPDAALAQVASDQAARSPWGPDDQIGALNRMTEDSRARILRQVAGGKVYDLGVELFVGMPNCCGALGDPGFQIWMTHAPARGGEELLSYSGDAVSMYTHTGTHIDALNHFGLHGRIWNRVEAADALGERGWSRSGVDRYPPIVARGVLIDVAGAKGLERLPSSYTITVADLENALARQQTALEPGDVVLIRTGMMTVWPDPARFRMDDQPGLGLEAARWLVDEHEAMLIGADNFAVERTPSPRPDNFVPLHSYLFAERGVSIIEVMWLEDLARDAVYEFLFVGAPLKLRGATGGPIRPLALPIRLRG